MKRISAAGFFLAALLCVPAARGQQATPDQNQSSPITPDQPLPPTNAGSSGNTSGGTAAPAGRSILDSDSTDSSQGTTENEMLPLSGSRDLGVAFAGEFRNYFDASALFSGGG